MERAKEEVSTITISGAVGTYATADPAIEAHVAKELGLKPETVATQVIPRDRHAMFFATLGVIASSIENLAVEIRHLQRTEVREAAGAEFVERAGADARFRGVTHREQRARDGSADGAQTLDVAFALDPHARPLCEKAHESTRVTEA